MQTNRSKIHERARVFTILASFILGWVITFCGFIAPPMGEIDNSVVVIFGQALTYCAIGLGMKDYVDARTSKDDDIESNSKDI